MKARCCWLRVVLAVFACFGLTGFWLSGEPAAASPLLQAPIGWMLIPLAEQASFPTLELDSEGLAHAAYYDSASQAVIYAYQRPDKTWVKVQAVPDLTGLASAPSLLLDPNGSVHLAFLTSAGRLGYTYRDCTPQGCSWRPAVYALESFMVAPGAMSPLALDSGGQPHVLAGQEIGSAVIVRDYYQEDGWRPRNFVSSAIMGTPLDLVNDDYGNLYAAYSGAESSLLCATFFIGVLYWDESCNIPNGGSLVDLEWENGLYAAYYQPGDASLWVAFHDVVWQRTMVIPPGGTPSGILALSFQIHQGRPHMAVSAADDSLTYILQAADGVWHSSDLPVAGWQPILRLDSAGRALIAFEDTLGRVMLAVQTENTFFPILYR